MHSKHFSTGLAIAVKLLITVALMWFVFAKLDLKAIRDQLVLLDPFWISAAFAVVFGTYLCGAARASTILRLFGEHLDGRTVLRVCLIGAFFSQALVTFLSGDAMRVWCFSRKGIPLVKAASAVLLDRALGIIAMAILLFVTLPAMLQIVTDESMRLGLITLAGLCFLAVAVFIALGIIKPLWLHPRPWVDMLLNLATVSRHTWERPREFSLALALSIGIQLGNTLAIYFISLGFGLPIGFVECLQIVPTVILLSMLPISVAGWGVREGVMAIAFGLLGFAPEPGVAVSILFGLALLAASLPGCVLWLRVPNPAARTNSGELPL